MDQNTSVFQYLLLLCTLLLVLQRAEAATFHPRSMRPMPARRQTALCEPSTPGVSEDAIIQDACNQNPQNPYNVCYNQLVVYVQESANNVCAHYYAVYNDCLVLNNYNETACPDAKLGYLDCSNYTLQAYAYCGCYYSLPADMYTCANVELLVRPSAAPATSSLPTASNLPILTGPVTTSGQSLLTNFPAPFASTSSSSGSDMTTHAATVATSSLTQTLPSLTVVSTPTLPSLLTMSNIIKTPTTVRPLSSTDTAANATAPVVPVSTAAGTIGGAEGRVAVQTTSVGVCVMRKRTRILRAV